MTLPASTFEKFVEIKTVGFILFCVYFLIYAIIVGIVHLKTGATIWILSAFNANADHTGLIVGTGLILFVCTFQYMCCITLRKFPLGVGTLFLFVYAFAISFTILGLFKVDYPGLFFGDLNAQNGLIQASAFIETMTFLTKNNMWCMYLSAVLLMFISFLKLKEKQIR